MATLLQAKEFDWLEFKSKLHVFGTDEVAILKRSHQMIRMGHSQCLSAVEQGKITVLGKEGLAYRQIPLKIGLSIYAICN